MTRAEASLIIRMELALAGEGIGARDPEPGDAEILKEAVRIAGDLFDPHWDLWDNDLITDEDHVHRCLHRH